MNNNNIIRSKRNLKLRRIGTQYMLVDMGDKHINMSEVYSMNKTASNIWGYICSGEYTFENIVEWMCEIYEVPKETAVHDLSVLLDEWKSYGLIL